MVNRNKTLPSRWSVLFLSCQKSTPSKLPDHTIHVTFIVLKFCKDEAFGFDPIERVKGES